MSTPREQTILSTRSRNVRWSNRMEGASQSLETQKIIQRRKFFLRWEWWMTNLLFRLTARVVAFVIVSICLTHAATPQSKSARFDPDGSFWIKGTHPDGFLDFGGINLN